jgi:two-component system response regulator FixJ
MVDAPQPKVFIVDDDEAMVESIGFLLESINLPFESYTNTQEFLNTYNPSGPGCMLLDIRMPGMSGLTLQGMLKTHNIYLPVIFITGHGDISMAIQAMKAGAFEFLTKPFNDQKLLDTINQALALDTKNRSKRLQFDTTAKLLKKLTKREYQVMELVVLGKLNKVVADKLDISQKTVELHRAKIMEKMRAKSLADLVTRIVLHKNQSKT